MKYLIYCCCIFLFSCSTEAQTSEYEALGKAQEVEGILEERRWAKSTESYCAQGSEYYVLTNAEESYLLKDISNFTADLEALEGKKLRLSVVKMRKTILQKTDMQQPISQQPQNSFPISQQPSNTFPGQENEASAKPQEETGFECTVWEVRKLEVL